ncbi:MAG: CAP domain-containing protein [Cyanobacteria bacterium J06634_6]
MFNPFTGKTFKRSLSIGLGTAIAAVSLGNFSQVKVSFDNSDSLLSSVSFSADSFLPGSAAQAQTVASRADSWSSLESEIIAEHSRVRQNPQSYIPLLEAYLATMNEDGHIVGGCGPRCILTTREGRPAVQEAIDFLRQQQPVGALSASNNIAQAAKSHAHDQRGGQVGHVSSDGSNFMQRLSRFGVQNAGMGENIAYGSTDAQDVVMKLIIDDGVANRGHRTNIFASDWTSAGAGCGTHAAYRTVCVINYATR